MTTRATKRLTAEAYLDLERRAERKSAFLDGETFTMSGASPLHVLIVSNLVTTLSRALRDRPCYVFAADLRLRVDLTGLYTYPDVMVACGALAFADDHRDTLLNPQVIVEVLSKSTEDHDRGGKFAHYRTIASVTDYLLVAQDRPHVERFTRAPDDRWIFSESDDPHAMIALENLGVEIPVADVYAKVDQLRA